jgi:hypothetical protein
MTRGELPSGFLRIFIDVAPQRNGKRTRGHRGRKAIRRVSAEWMRFAANVYLAP